MAAYDAPPSYQDAEANQGPPPTYDSLYGEFRDIEGPKGFLGFFGKVASFIVGTAVFAIVVALANIVPIIMIVIGALNLDNCPAQRYIPIWLIVAGAFTIVRSVLTMCYRMKRRYQDEESGPYDNVKQNPFDGLLGCFLLAWFICGTVWVYGTQVEYKKTSPIYCEQWTYLFSWWLITISYVMCVFFVFFVCCCGCCAICFGTRRNGEANAEDN